jgi:hypothetical protein
MFFVPFSVSIHLCKYIDIPVLRLAFNGSFRLAVTFVPSIFQPLLIEPKK